MRLYNRETKLDTKAKCFFTNNIQILISYIDLYRFIEQYQKE